MHRPDGVDCFERAALAETGVFGLLVALLRGEVISLGAGQESELVALATRHRVRPLLEGVAGASPVVREVLQQWVASSATRMVLLKHALSSLKDAGVDAVVVKGPALDALWGEQDLRDFDDLDIIVRQEQAVEAVRALCDAGYRLVPEMQPVALQRAAASGGAFQLYGAAGGCIEISTSGVLPYFPGIPSARFWRDTIEVSQAGFTFRSLDPVDCMLYISAHGCEHMWARLQWVRDIVRMVEALSLEQCQEVARRGRDYGLSRCVATAVSVGAMLGIPLDAAKARALCSGGEGGRAVTWLAERSVRSLLTSGGSVALPRWRMLQYQFYCRERWSTRLRMVWRLLSYPSQKDLLESERKGYSHRSTGFIRLMGLLRRRR